MRRILPKILLMLFLTVSGCVSTPEPSSGITGQIELAQTKIEQREYIQAIEIIRGLKKFSDDPLEVQTNLILDMVRQSAQDGSVRSMIVLASAYYAGEGVEQDFETAFALLQTAANWGDAEAKYHLGGMYYAGKGVERDKEKGRILIFESAHLGFSKAQLMYGAFLGSGVGGIEDSTAALKWFYLAAKNGEVVAEIYAGLIESIIRFQKVDFIVREDLIKFAAWVRLAERHSLQGKASHMKQLDLALEKQGTEFTPHEFREIEKRVLAWDEKNRDWVSEQKKGAP